MSKDHRTPLNSYGSSPFLLYEVVDSDGDEQEAGRIKVRRVGYEDDIPDDQLAWARPTGGTHNALSDKGIGGMITGVTNNSIVMGFYADGHQQPYFTHTVSKSGSGEGGQNFKDADLNRHSRTAKTGGGDFRYAGNKKDYDTKSIVVYARDDSSVPQSGRTESKDGSDDSNKSFSIGNKEIYA